jgi:hypothetical protein
MDEDRKKEQEDKGFVVKDRRFSAKKEGEESAPASKGERIEEPREESTSEEEVTLPEVNFISFLLSLHTSALIQMGEVQDPLTQKADKKLPYAKQTIDLIAMLKEKTKGNLTQEEERGVEHILYDLRMRYVKAAG